MIQKIEGKILGIKRKTNPKVIAIIFFCIFGFFTIFSMEMTNNFIRQKQLVQNEYNRSMYELIRYIKNIDLNLTKLKIINDKSLKIPTLANIWRESNLAKENLANLPIIQENMSNTSKYLTQVSDFSFLLLKELSKESTISDQQIADIEKLNISSTELLKVTNKIFEDLNSGRLKWDEVEKLGNEQLDENVAVSNIDSISKTFVEYEGLIYDGAYSEHIIDLKPKNLSENIVTENQAQENIINIFGGDNIENIDYIGESNNKLELYEFNVKLKKYENIRHIYMTKQDGRLYLMISDKTVKNQKITEDNAKEIAINFLENIGIDNVVDTYYLVTENLITINFACVQEDIILYPDLIKVKVALDNGEVCSVETGGYTFNHIVRDDLQPLITMNQAESKINKKLNVKSRNLAIIPTEAKNELLVYEFKAEIEDKKCIVYINALTGNEENVVMLIETPNGTLTM